VTARNFIYALAFTILVGLGGWTLRGVKELETQTARLETSVEWEKTILTELSHRINDIQK
jgi:hypothetical protein